MKTLKITLALVVLLLLTVSVVKSDKDTVAIDDQPTFKEHKSYDLMAHNKIRVRIKTRG